MKRVGPLVEGVATDDQVKNNNSSGINVVEIRDIDIEKKIIKKENKNKRHQKKSKKYISFY